MNFESEDVRYQSLEEYPFPEYPYTMPPEAPPHPVAYYYLLGKFSIPSLERIQKELLAETERRFNERLDLTPFEGQADGTRVEDYNHFKSVVAQTRSAIVNSILKHI